MKLAIIGLEQSGKTTVFNALTGAHKEVGTHGRIGASIASVKVPDERMEWLINHYNPKKTVYADIEFIDIPGSINDSSDPNIIAAARETDAFVYVMRAFRNESVPHPLENIEPVRDFAQISTGLIVADMVTAEKRIERIELTLKKHTGKEEEEKLELAALKKVMEKLELEYPASEAELTDAEKKSLRGFQFLTLKPHFEVLNVSEDMLDSDETKEVTSKIPDCMPMCASMEMEIRGLDEGERAPFLEDLGVKELSLNAFIRKAYETLGLISFFTVGPNEVHAWTIPRDTNAQAAAGKIHSDMARGFIRAEVIAFDDLRALGGEREVKHAGKLRTEGKDYIVRDGDILFIKFSV